MKVFRSGRLFFRLVSLALTFLHVLLPVDSLMSWTVQPANPTKAIKGKDISLGWDFFLNSTELTQSQTYYTIIWKKFNDSTLSYSPVGSLTYLRVVGRLQYSEPLAPHIVVDRAEEATLQIKNVIPDDEGRYKIEYSVDLAGTVLNEDEVNLTVEVPSEITGVSHDQVICEGSLVVLSCNATGKPAPTTFNWTKVEDDVTDSAPLLPVVDGNYVLSNIQRSANGTYRCTADNGVGVPVNRTVSVKVEYSPGVERIVHLSNSVIEGQSFNMTCVTSGYPEPNVYWIKENNYVRINGSVLNFTSINRNDSGQYRCEAKNDCGSNSSVQSIDVFFKPDTVELSVNITENRDCSDFWVNFTCVASEANPAVYNFLLYEKDGDISQSKSGIWIKKISKGGKYVYRCIARHVVGNVTSSNNVTLTVNVPASVNQLDNKTVEKDNNVSLNCNVMGFPAPFIEWSKVGSAETIEDRFYNITSITRADRGQYKCFANNTCGSDVKVTSINVQFKPENVNLTANVTTKETCLGLIVKFTCAADANPEVDKYSLYENDTIVDMDVSGVWIRPLNTSGHVMYRCRANNSLGNETSKSITVTVGVPASVNQLDNKTVEKDNNVSLNCNVMGFPAPFVAWSKVGSAETIEDRFYNITSITRADRGQYKCFANNTCGSDVKVTSINVQYPPNITYISEGMTVNQSESVNLTCRADGNPKPSITWTKDGNITNSSFTVRGKSDEGLYVCTADNGIGNVSSKSVLIAVEYFGPFNTSHTTLTKIPNIVYLNTPFNLSCSAQAKPPASYRFYRGQESLGNISVGNTLEISVVERTNQVNYACIPFNQFGDGRAKIVPVEVYYSPQVTESDKTISVSLGNSATLTCPVDGNPPPSVEWYQRNVINVQTLRRGKTWEINNATLSDSGLYTCSASNPVGSVTATVILEVVSPTNSPQDNYKVRVKLVDSQFLPDYVNLNSQPAQELISAFVAEVNKLYENYENYDRTEVTKLSNGSVIVSFVVYFTTTVTENEGLAKLRDAVDNNKKLGNFTADALEVIQVNPTTAASNERSTGNPSNSRQKDGPPWPIIGGIIGAVVAVIIVILLVAWWVHNKRKCRRKDTKIHNSESEVLHGQNDIEDGAYARVNGGYGGRYADSGPPSANGTNKFVQQPQPQPEQQQQQQAAAAPPAHAVVDKSKKKKKAEAEDPYAEVEDPNKDKKTADPSTHDYAVVNKSKKKKKEEDENAYATVDKSKKSKKGQQKPKAPGEVLYADLGDFQPVQPLPTVSTSPEPLAPLKRPPSYQGTEYADITQFLKGNATLPEGQSTEMQPTYANAGGGQEAANKENANKGGEGDIEPKETPM